MIIVRRKNPLIHAVLKISMVTLAWLQTQRALLLRLVILMSLLVVAPMIGILVVKEDPFFVLIAAVVPLGLVALQLILPRFELYPLLILFAAAFVPLQFPTGTESKLVDSFLLTILFVGNWVLKMMIVDKRFSLKPSPVNKPLLGFMFITLFSVIWSTVFRDPLVTASLWKTFPFVQLASTLTIIMLPGAFLLVANHINNVKLLKAMVVMMLVAGSIGIFQRFIIGYSVVPINDNGLFTMWIVSLGLGMGLFNQEWSWKWRGAVLVLGGAAFIFRFAENITWLAGWLPGLIALSVVIFMRSKKLFFTAVIVGAIFIGINKDYYLGKVVADENAESGVTRAAAWEVNWRVTGKHLLFGTGPAGYAVYYMTYFPKDGVATHNTYIDVVAQCGLVGFGLYVWFFFTLAWLGYKVCLRLKGQNNFSEALANVALAGTISCIISMGFGDWLLPFAYTQGIVGFDYVVYSWLFMGTILVLDHLSLTKTEMTPSLINKIN